MDKRNILARTLRMNSTIQEKRLWNNEIYENIEGVLERIEQEIMSRYPSPTGEGRNSIRV